MSAQEWPDVLQQSYTGAVENHRQALHQAQTNLQQWAEEYVPGESAATTCPHDASCKSRVAV